MPGAMAESFLMLLLLTAELVTSMTHSLRFEHRKVEQAL